MIFFFLSLFGYQGEGGGRKVFFVSINKKKTRVNTNFNFFRVTTERIKKMTMEREK